MEAVSAILGKTSRHWNNYEQILTLCDPALTLAHQAGLTEWALRKIVGENLPCEVQVRRIQEMITGKPLEKERTKFSRLSRPAMAVKTALDAATFWALLPSGELDRVAADTFNACDADDFEALYQIVEKIVIALGALREQDIDKFSQRKQIEAKRLRKASDYLSSLQPDNLDRAITELFSDQRIANLEKFYQAGGECELHLANFAENIIWGINSSLLPTCARRSSNGRLISGPSQSWRIWQ